LLGSENLARRLKFICGNKDLPPTAETSATLDGNVCGPVSALDLVCAQ
jgi:hypothetical protein